MTFKMKAIIEKKKKKILMELFEHNFVYICKKI